MDKEFLILFALTAMLFAVIVFDVNVYSLGLIKEPDAWQACDNPIYLDTKRDCELRQALVDANLWEASQK
jgi:hypothetical protein